MYPIKKKTLMIVPPTSSQHSPQPGMRHAAEMNSRQQSQGSGRGMMGVVLPMYAVGIVCYLLYTLYKVSHIYFCCACPKAEVEYGQAP